MKRHSLALIGLTAPVVLAYITICAFLLVAGFFGQDNKLGTIGFAMMFAPITLAYILAK